EIRHGVEMMTRYAHLDAFAGGLEVGEHIPAGHRIGDVGATGLATGPHLHYEVRFAGDPVDPLSDERIAALGAPASDAPAGALERLRHDFRQALRSKSHA